MKFLASIFIPGLILGFMSLIFAATHGLMWWVLAGWILVSGLGIAAGFHRIFSHKTHNLKPWLENIILFLGSLGGQGSSITWVAVHRGYHHRHSDTEKDLHSPIHGWLSAFMGWYARIDPQTINHKYAVDLLRRPNHVWFHKNYMKFMAIWVIVLALLGPKFLAVYGSVLFISLLQDNLVNLLCHIPGLGYRNHDTRDNSNNFPPLGYLGWGQGWHNSHHAYPASYLFGTKWWEFDACAIFIPLLKLGSKHE